MRLPSLEHHRVDGANSACLRRQFVEQRDDGLLAGNVMFRPVEALPLGGGDSRSGSGVASSARLIEIDQAIEVTQTLRIAFMLVHGRRVRDAWMPAPISPTRIDRFADAAVTVIAL